MTEGLRLGRLLQVLLVGVLAVGVVPGGAVAGHARAPQPSAAVTSEGVGAATTQAMQLVFLKRQSYVRWTPGSRRRPAQILPARQMSALDMAGADHRVFFLHSPANSLRTSVRRVSATGRHQVTLVERAGVALDLAASRRFVVWDRADAIARVRVDGSNMRRRWLVLPRRARQGDGSLMNGMTTHGRFLYLSQCARGRIGRVRLAARRPQVEWFVSGITTCPMDLTVAGDFIYWEGSTFRSGAGVIGRAPAAGGSPENRWTVVRSFDGPDDIEASGRFVYWTWGGSGPRPRHFLGRVRHDGSGFDRKFRRIGGSLLTRLAPQG